jgi:hypothetical protein
MDDALAMASLFPIARSSRRTASSCAVVVEAAHRGAGRGLFTVRRDLKALAHERDELVARIEGSRSDQARPPRPLSSRRPWTADRGEPGRS